MAKAAGKEAEEEEDLANEIGDDKEFLIFLSLGLVLSLMRCYTLLSFA